MSKNYPIIYSYPASPTWKFDYYKENTLAVAAKNKRDWLRQVKGGKMFLYSAVEKIDSCVLNLIDRWPHDKEEVFKKLGVK